MDQHVAAPDQVGRPRPGRDVCRCPGLKDQAALAGGRAGDLDVPAHRVDPGDVESEPPVQRQRLPALAAAHVERDRAWRQAQAGDEIKQKVRAARVQALIQCGREFLLMAWVLVLPG